MKVAMLSKQWSIVPPAGKFFLLFKPYKQEIYTYKFMLYQSLCSVYQTMKLYGCIAFKIEIGWTPMVLG